MARHAGSQLGILGHGKVGLATIRGKATGYAYWDTHGKVRHARDREQRYARTQFGMEDTEQRQAFWRTGQREVCQDRKQN